MLRASPRPPPVATLSTHPHPPHADVLASDRQTALEIEYDLRQWEAAMKEAHKGGPGTDNARAALGAAGAGRGGGGGGGGGMLARAASEPLARTAASSAASHTPSRPAAPPALTPSSALSVAGGARGALTTLSSPTTG